MKYEDLDDWLSVDQVAEYLGVGRNTVYSAVLTGQIPSRRFVGRTIRIPKTDVVPVFHDG